MEAAGAQARYEALHKDRPYHDGGFKNWASERSVSHPYHFRDGVTIWAASEDANPDDNFLGSAKEASDGDSE